MKNIFVMLCLGLALATSGLANATDRRSTPANHYVFLDVTGSVPLVQNEAYAQRAAASVSSLLANSALLGDTIYLQHIGDRNWDILNPKSWTTGRKLRVSKLAGGVAEYIAGIPNEKFTVSETSIFFALQTAPIQCSPGSTVILLTDGLETGRETNLMDVLSGEKQFATPAREYLKGCSVSLVGLGIPVSDEGAMSIGQLDNLEAAYRTYFVAAGVHPDDISIKNLF